MSATHFKGPVVSENGFTAGSGGVQQKAVKSGTVSVNPGTLAAGAELDISVTISGVAAGDIVQLMPPDAAMETGLGIVAVWVSAANTVKIRVTNLNAVAALVGGAQNWTYLHTDLT